MAYCNGTWKDVNLIADSSRFAFGIPRGIFRPPKRTVVMICSKLWEARGPTTFKWCGISNYFKLDVVSNGYGA